jgi:putative SOS response-associated peptidase YedK
MQGNSASTLSADPELFQTRGELPNWPTYYNAAPTTALPLVRQTKDDGNRKLVLMQWGLVPWFSKDGKPSYSTINARAESVQTNASYREPFKTRRCIVPASGYFEWTGPKNDRQPHYFTRADGQPMALAGLWDRWRSKDRSETKETFTIITTEPSKFAAQFHNRMPLVLESETWDLWIEGESDAAAALMKPSNEDVLTSRLVNKAVGNVKNNCAELLG